MKKITFILLALALVLCIGTAAAAQPRSSARASRTASIRFIMCLFAPI